MNYQCQRETFYKNNLALITKATQKGVELSWTVAEPGKDLVQRTIYLTDKEACGLLNELEALYR